ncbi:hypothetical protein BDZ88DRAFT_441120 [Geranomyces variabilis]|nr:hypothetical protein BDZ88DRAFT_441120 [Geranomyces variabilis]
MLPRGASCRSLLLFLRCAAAARDGIVAARLAPPRHNPLVCVMRRLRALLAHAARPAGRTTPSPTAQPGHDDSCWCGLPGLEVEAAMADQIPAVGTGGASFASSPTSGGRNMDMTFMLSTHTPSINVTSLALRRAGLLRQVLDGNELTKEEDDERSERDG